MISLRSSPPRAGIRSAWIAAVTIAAACGGSQQPAPLPPPEPVGTPTPEEPVRKPPTPAPVVQTAQPQDLAFPDEEFRAKQPEGGKPRPFQLPKVRPFKLKDGVQVYLVEKHDLPIISVDLVFDGGAAGDPTGKEGLSSVCTSLLTEGTEKLDKLAYSEALSDIASTIETYAADDYQGVTMSTLSKHMEPTFALYVDTLLHPGFRPEDLDRLVKRRLEGLKQAKGTPSAVASRVSSPVLYGAKHPLGHVQTEASLAAITLDDCKAFHAAWFKPNSARLFVVGDLTEAQVRAYFDGPLLAAWKGKGQTLAKLPKPATRPGRIFLVHIPGAAQSQVALLHFGPKRTAPDYFPTAIMSSVIGGGFTSRLNMNLREDKGYSYAARGGIGYTRNYGVFNAGASVRTDSTYQSILEIDREVKELQAGKMPPTDDEVTREKASAILGLPARFATGSASLGSYRALVYFGLPLDYYDSYVAKVDKVAPKDVAAAAKKHLKPGEAVYVVVGDADAPMVVREGKEDKPLLKEGKQLTLRQALESLVAAGTLGPGALVELDADGQPKP